MMPKNKKFIYIAIIVLLFICLGYSIYQGLSAQNKYESMKTELSNENESTKTELAKKYESQITALAKQYESQITELSDKYESTITELSNKYKSTITQLDFKNVGKLVSQEGYFTSVQDINNDRTLFGFSVPFTAKKYIFSYDGKVTAGVDFEKIELSIDEVNHTITARLPKAQLFNVAVDRGSMKVYYEGDNIFNSFSISEMNESGIEMENEIRQKAIAHGILENATKNAKGLLRAFISQAYDLTEWKVVIYEEEEA